MDAKKGFTLIEILTVLVIIGILAVVAVPAYTTILMQGSARAAQNNLITIYNAQKTYYFNNAAYCTASCNSLTNINSALALNISDNNFGYSCANTGGFTCTATNNSNPNLQLTLINAPIVLPGASGTPNPSCTPFIYCPTG